MKTNVTEQSLADILVVDDEPENLKFLAGVLSSEGYRVRPVCNGEFAIKSALGFPPDLILTDIMMPGLDGYDLCYQLKKNVATQNIPVIFISGKTEAKAQLNSYKLGASDYLTKPVHPDVLVARVKIQLELTAHRHHLEQLVASRTSELNSEIDIRRKAQHNLQSAERKLSAIIDTFYGFIYTTRLEDPYRIEYMNQSIKDYLAQEKKGQLFCHEVFFNRKSPCPGCKIEQIREEKLIDTEYQLPDNGMWFRVLHSLLEVDGAGTRFRQTIMMDITQNKKAEQELKQREAFLDQENKKLRHYLRDRFKFGNTVGRSPKMQKVFEKILHAAESDATVVIYGESGTGKELAAVDIHEQSARKDKKMVSINCGAIPGNLAESELFGHKKGAFTGADKDKRGCLEDADGGTVFLDEISQLSLEIQVKLLRVLDGYGFSPLGSGKRICPNNRFIMASNRDLKEMVREGTMREDFYYRVQVIPVSIPPLRDRKEDIPLLVDFFLKKFQPEKRPVIPATVLEVLESYDWPGNIRELKNTIQRYAVLGTLDLIGVNRINEMRKPVSNENEDTVEHLSLREELEYHEKETIIKTLNHFNWRRDKTATKLGITPKTLYRRMKQYGLIN